MNATLDAALDFEGVSLSVRVSVAPEAWSRALQGDQSEAQPGSTPGEVPPAIQRALQLALPSMLGEVHQELLACLAQLALHSLRGEPLPGEKRILPEAAQ